MDRLASAVTRGPRSNSAVPWGGPSPARAPDPLALPSTTEPWNNVWVPVEPSVMFVLCHTCAAALASSGGSASEPNGVLAFNGVPAGESPSPVSDHQPELANADGLDRGRLRPSS